MPHILHPYKTSLIGNGIPSIVDNGGENLVIFDSDLTNAAWTKSNVAASISGTSPDGVSSASLITEDSTNGLHRFFQSETAAAGKYILSVYAKPNGRNWIYLYFVGGLAQAYFNISTGAVGTTIGTSLISAGSQWFGNGWYKVNIIVNNTITTQQNLIINLASANGITSYAGNGTSGVYFYKFQLFKL
jgi:hypothetical protein